MLSIMKCLCSMQILHIKNDVCISNNITIEQKATVKRENTNRKTIKQACYVYLFKNIALKRTTIVKRKKQILVNCKPLIAYDSAIIRKLRQGNCFSVSVSNSAC